MIGIADISMFVGLQAAQHARWGISEIGVFNAYSKEESQRRVKMCESELDDIYREFKDIQSAFLRAHSTYRMQQYMHGQGKEDNDRKKELEIRVDALKNRIAQLKDTATKWRFDIPCFDIETKLKEFQSRIMGAVDTPMQRNIHNAPSLTGLSVFNNPSK